MSWKLFPTKLGQLDHQNVATFGMRTLSVWHGRYSSNGLQSLQNEGRLSPVRTNRPDIVGILMREYQLPPGNVALE